jgi:hypothetical protein
MESMGHSGSPGLSAALVSVTQAICEIPDVTVRLFLRAPPTERSQRPCTDYGTVDRQPDRRLPGRPTLIYTKYVNLQHRVVERADNNCSSADLISKAGVAWSRSVFALNKPIRLMPHERKPLEWNTGAASGSFPS